jgi:hypothetical protein
MQEDSIIVLDGANIFDLTLITQLSKSLNMDTRALLQRIHLSRAFTVHQLEAVISDRLKGALQKYGSRMLLVSGLLDTFWDEEVPLWEASRILRKVMGKLRQIAVMGCRVVLIAPDPPVPMSKRMGLVSITTKNADRLFSLSEIDGVLTMRDDATLNHGKQWEIPAIKFFKPPSR